MSDNTDAFHYVKYVYPSAYCVSHGPGKEEHKIKVFDNQKTYDLTGWESTIAQAWKKAEINADLIEQMTNPVK